LIPAADFEIIEGALRAATPSAAAR
jgi:hypothetical protein